MEFEGKANAVILSTTPSKTLDHIRRHPPPDPKPEPDPDPDPVSASPPTPPSPPAVSAAQRPSTRSELTARLLRSRYRECQRNHAAVTGGLVIDGCGEFMPGGEEDTPDALKCAACGCHRSFHRKEVDGQDSQTAAYMYAQRTAPALYCSGSYRAMQTHAMHRTAGIARRSSSSEEMNDEKRSGKKRLRTKINQEQKDKMKEFAERLGWSLQKKDEEEVDKFCSMVNLRREVFKVWMHNNKQAMKRKLSLPN
ncbi:PREDICTED: zinc-finger homeodomain protein 7-like [Tarenaya hassleriana]|uniref:zinc-finger homeodomain protein 7-like n=1 Tax=Tarenaya hassleriana TaxID=28532 RepID=UPI00053C184C|nr:PREDICTED: zinc-finger homeodomain protein 7-like [Tarenaya hassleriana]